MTYRDEGGRVVTEGVQSGGADLSAVEAYQRDNIFLGGQLVSSGVWSGSGWTTLNYQFYAVDHLGSTRLVTDVSSNLVQVLKYWPYGDDAPGSGSDAGQRLKFAGMERDTENRHYFDHARTQDFNLGRFVSADELFGDQETPQSWNRYSYVMNNPTSLTDPWGYDSQVSCPPDPFGIIQGCSTSITVGGDAVPATPSNIGSDWAHRLDWYLPTWNSFSQYYSRLGSESRDDESFAASVIKAFGSNLISSQFWKNEFSKEGCINVFTEGVEAADILAPVTVAFPDVGETAIKGQASNAAVAYAAARNLSVPMRSSVVREILYLGDAAANAFAPLYIDLQVGYGVLSEMRALGKGECH